MQFRLVASLFACAIFCTLVAGQEKAAADQRGILQQVLIQNYQPSDVGKHMMGVGAESDIRRPGIIVVIQRTGLYGSLIRNEIASSAIHGDEAKLYRGHEDYAIPVGERFYVTIVNVGSSTINFGLLSARAVSTKAGSGRVWCAPTFYFPENVLTNSDKDAVIRGIDPWFVPEGRNTAALPPPQPQAIATSPQVAPTSAPRTVPQVAQIDPQTIRVEPGMTEEQVVAKLGKAPTTLDFGSKKILQYPAFTLVFGDGKLVSIESQSDSARSKVTLDSDPAGAEIYLDSQLVGSTPSTLQITQGAHHLVLKLSGYEDWVRDLNVLPLSDIRFAPKLAKQ